MFSFYFYGKNAAGRNIIYPCIGKTIGKISDAGIVGKYSNAIKLIIQFNDHIVKNILRCSI